MWDVTFLLRVDIGNWQKDFELQKDADNVKVGDTLIFEGWVSDDNGDGHYTGRRVQRIARYIIRDAEDWCLE